MIRTGRQYLDALGDGRDVRFIDGRVSRVTEDPHLAGCARTVAGLYDLQHDPAHAGVLTEEENGATYSRAYARPRTVEELRGRRAVVDLLARLTAGTMGRMPDYVPLVLLGLLNEGALLSSVDPRYAANVETYFAYCRERDLCMAHSFADPQVDRSKPSHEVNYLRVTGISDAGLTVRGVKTVATLAPFADEYLVVTPPRNGLTRDQAICFAVPVATAGLHFECRASYGGGDVRAPLSNHFDEIDALAVFDDVHVPADRVFFFGDPRLLGRLWRHLNSWTYYHMLVRLLAKSELFAGVCIRIAKTVGTFAFPNVRDAIGDVLRYTEALRAFIRASEAEAWIMPSGLAMPEPRTLATAHMYAIEHYPRLPQTVAQLSGQSLLLLPYVETDTVVRQTFGATAESLAQRESLFRLAWDLACSPFAARQTLFESFNARDLTKNRAMFVDAYDTTRLEGLVDHFTVE